jgi:hypothetical protein
VLENCLNQNVKIFVIPSKTNLTECYIIQNGEDLNDRISECFRRTTTETASNQQTKKTQLDPKPQLPPRLLKQRQQQAGGGGRVVENDKRGPSQKEIRLRDRDDRERPREPPVMDRSNSYDSRGGGGLDKRDWNQDRDRDRDLDHEPPYKRPKNNWQRAHPEKRLSDDRVGHLPEPSGRDRDRIEKENITMKRKDVKTSESDTMEQDRPNSRNSRSSLKNKKSSKEKSNLSIHIPEIV